MPDCTTALNCCPGDNSFDYEVDGSLLLNVTTSSSPEDGGVTTGDGQYAAGAEVVVTATPGVPTSIDVGVDMVFVADESGLGEFCRILMNTIVPEIDPMLQALGIGSATVVNRYGLVGHASLAGGTHGGVPDVAHTHFALGDFATFLTSINELATIPSGGPVEDGYEALSYTAANMAWRESGSVAKVVVFITDEDRNVHRYVEGGLTQAEQFAAIKAEMVAAGLHLVGILSQCNPQDGSGNPIIGFKRDPDKTWRADGLGGYTNGTGGAATTEGSTDATYPTGMNTEYLELALDPDINGEMWDYDAFRVGIGTCDTNGTAVTRITGNSFPFAGAIAGEPITINYVDYIIDSVTDGDNLVLTTSAGVQSGVDWSVPRVERESFLAAFTDSIEESITSLVEWQFAGWYDGGGALLSTDPSFTFTVQNHTALEARFTHA